MITAMRIIAYGFIAFGLQAGIFPSPLWQKVLVFMGIFAVVEGIAALTGHGPKPTTNSEDK